MRSFVRILMPLLGLAALILVLANSSAQDPQKGKDGPNIKGGLPDKEMPKADQPKLNWPTQFDTLTLDDWIKRLDSKDPSTRNAAVRVIPQFGPAAKKAIDKLISLMSDPDNSVKIGALLACTTYPYEDPKLVEKTVIKLNSLLKNNDEAVRFQAALACTRLGQAAKSCIPAICSEYVLNCSTSYEVRAAGAIALGQIAYEDQNKKEPDLLFAQAVSALAHRLSDPAYAVRLASIEALMITGAPKDITGGAARLLMTTLVDRTRNEKDEVVKMWVRVCSMRFDRNQITTENISGIGINLKTADDHLQLQAAKALGCMGPVAKSQVPALIECMKAAGERKSLYVLVMCMFALAQMGADAGPALPDIEKYLNHENPIVKDQAKKSMDLINAAKVKKN